MKLSINSPIVLNPWSETGHHFHPSEGQRASHFISYLIIPRPPQCVRKNSQPDDWTTSLFGNSNFPCDETGIRSLRTYVSFNPRFIIGDIIVGVSFHIKSHPLIIPFDLINAQVRFDLSDNQWVCVFYKTKVMWNGTFYFIVASWKH